MPKRKNKKEELEKKLNLIKTLNGQLICRLMVQKEIKGSYKDYVIVCGNEIVEWRQKFPLLSKSGKEINFEMILIHKSALHRIVGHEIADKIWHPVMGRLVTVPEGTKKKGES